MTHAFHRCAEVADRTGYTTRPYKRHDKMYVYKVIHLLRATNLISLITSALTVAFIDHEGEPQNRASQSGGRDIPRDPIRFDLY